MIELIAGYAQQQPDKIAVVDRGTEITYRQLNEEVKEFGNLLINTYPSDTKVCILLPNSYGYVKSFLASIAVGMTAVPIDPRQQPDTIAAILDNIEPEIIITSSLVMRFFRRHGTNLLLDNFTRSTERKIWYIEEVINGNDGIINDLASNFQVILHTSGTTGIPKGVILNKNNLLAAQNNIIQTMAIGSWIIESITMGMSHSFGFARLRCVLAVGGTVILEDGLLYPDLILSNILAYHVNTISMVPSAWKILFVYLGDQIIKIGPQIKSIEIGSEFLSTELSEKIMRTFPRAEIYVHYGMTEASRSTFLNLRQYSCELNSVGQPAPNVTIQIRDSSGKPCPTGKSGHIAIKADTVMRGYWRDPIQTESRLQDGWFISADQGYSDRNGFLHLTGRTDDVVNVGGNKFKLQDVLNVIISFPGVGDAKLKLKQDGFLTAYISKNIGSLELTELKRYCAGKLEPHQMPTQFLFDTCSETTQE